MKKLKDIPEMLLNIGNIFIQKITNKMSYDLVEELKD